MKAFCILFCSLVHVHTTSTNYQPSVLAFVGSKTISDYGYAHSGFKVTHFEVARIYRIILSVDRLVSRQDDNYVIVFDGRDCLAPRLAVIYQFGQGNVVSKGNQLTTLFLADTDNIRTFDASYYQIPKSKIDGNATDVDSGKLSGLLHNCGQDHLYGDGQIDVDYETTSARLCIWRLSVAPPSRIEIRITLREQSKKGHDLRIFDGSSCGDAQIYQNKENDTLDPKRITTRGYVAVIMFKRPVRARPFNGFFIEYKKLIPPTPTTPSTTTTTTTKTTTTGIIPLHENCGHLMLWRSFERLRFEASGSTVGIHTFHESRITTKDSLMLEFAVCSLQQNGTVVLFDGHDCMTQRIGVVRTALSDTFRTTGPTLTMLFFSHRKLQQKYFHGIYVPLDEPVSQIQVGQSSILKTCGSELFGNGVMITPQNTTLEVLCVWRITEDPKKVIKLKINSFGDLYENKWLRIINGAGCGGYELLYFDMYSGRENNIRTYGNQVVVVSYQPSGGNPDHYFRIIYEEEDNTNAGNSLDLVLRVLPGAGISPQLCTAVKVIAIVVSIFNYLM